MTKKKPLSQRPEKEAPFCEEQHLLEELILYLADLAAEEQLKRASKDRKS